MTGNLYLSYIEDTIVGPGQTHRGTVKFTRSMDGGATWSTPATLGDPYTSGARCVVGPDGEVYVGWVDVMARQIMMRRSRDQGASFDPPTVVSAIELNALNPTNWANAIIRSIPGYPNAGCYGIPGLLELAVDRSAGPTRGRLHATWTEHAMGTLLPLRSVGEQEPNETPAQATPVRSGDVVSGTLSGPKFPPDSDCDLFVFDGVAGTTLQLSGTVCGRTPGGTSVTQYSIVTRCADDPHGALLVGCWDLHCTDEMPPAYFSLPTTGRYYVSLHCQFGSIDYTFRLQEVAVAPGSVARDHRDVVLASSADGGATWSAKRRVNDDAAGHDNSLPSVAVDADGLVHVAWYDRRQQPECGAVVHTYWTHSADGGMSFAPSVALSDSAADLRHLQRNVGFNSAAQWRVGDYLALEAAGDQVHAVWAQPLLQPGTLEMRGDLFGVVIAPDSAVTPVRVGSLRAEAMASRVRLEWRVSDASGIEGFRLHRAAGAGDAYLAVNEVIPSRGEGEYREIDASVSPGETYRYRLEVRRASGSSWLGPVEVTVPEPPIGLSWRALPNPFGESIQLELTVERSTHATVRIYDVAGHEVARLFEGEIAAGTRRLRWDVSRDGRPAPGVYLVRATAGRTTATTRIALVR